MPPFSCQPCVIIIQPTNHTANVKSRCDRVKFIMCTWNRNTGFNIFVGKRQRAKVLFTGVELKCHKPTSQTIHQAIACRLKGLFTKTIITHDIIGNFNHNIVIIRAHINCTLRTHKTNLNLLGLDVFQLEDIPNLQGLYNRLQGE